MTVPVDAWIHALQLRLRLVAPHRRTLPGEFPPGWQQWFTSMPPRAGAVTGASARSVAAAMAQRPLRAPPRASAELNRWQALRALGRQQWHPPDADERPLRWFAAFMSAAWHVFLAAMLVWLIYQQYITESHPPPKGEEMVVQIEYIGEGTAEEVGGGPAPESGQQQNPVAADNAPDASEPDVPVPSATPLQQVAEQPAAEPEPVPPTVVPVPPEPVAVQEPVETVPVETPQPLTVSEPVADANDQFVLPPTTQRLDAPVLVAPELQMSIPAIEVVDVPTPVPTPPRPSVSVIAPAQVDMPVLEQRAPEIVVREIPAPAPETPLPPLPQLPAPSMAQPTVDVTPRELQAPALQTRQIPAVAAAPAPQSSQPANQPANQPATSEPATSQTPAPAASADPLAQTTATPPGGADQADASSTAGPEETPAPGGWPTPERGDDWGAAARERPGKQLGEPGGLYNSDGSTKLAEVPGSAAPGQPPGAITDEIVNLDRNGTWLKRAPNDYEPTAFDEYWRPTESLLEEWVRKSITTVRIPIPGTSKHIVCHTVLLALGGACGITDPNMVDQPATARPSPDIPFKPELQGDNGSVPADDQ